MPVFLLTLAVLLAPVPAVARSVRLDSALEQVAQERERRGSGPALQEARARGLRTRGADRVAVVVEAEAGQAADVRRRLARLGARASHEMGALTRVWVPLRNLRALAREPGVRFVRPPLRAIPAGFGATETQGVALTGAHLLHEELVTGEGVETAVVDLDFLGFAAAKAQGEIPAGAAEINLTDAPLPFEDASTHGTAVSEILMDMAPGAGLHAIKIENEFDLQQAADYIHANGIRVVNMSLAFANGSYYDNTGPVNDIINASHDDFDVFWVIAAGNFSLRHWNGTWIDNDGDRRIEFDGVSDERILVEGTSGQICIHLNWDEYGAPQMDLGLYVYRASGSLKTSSDNNQPPSGPAEGVCFDALGGETPYEIEVRRHPSSPVTGSRITIFSALHNLEGPHRIRAESLMDPANAVGAFSIATIAHMNWTLPAPNVQGYSSRGPTHDGRIKPDLTAMDGVTTSSQGLTAGTSFAAPHVAGAAALLLAQDPLLTATDLHDELQAVAIDQGDPGIDTLFGAGQMVADESLGGLLDSDLDTVGNQADNCRYEPNTPQLDTGAIAGPGPDGVGNACQCGDVDDDGAVLQADVNALRDLFAGMGGPAAPQKCNVIGPADGGVGDCDQIDAVIMRRTLAIQAPIIDQVCAPALP